MSSGLFSPPRVNRAVDGWEQRSLRSMLSARSERNRSDLPLLTVARERGVFVRSAEDANHNAIPEDLSNYKVARRGDLVINKMKAWQGSLGLAPVDGIVSPAYFVFSADFAVPEFGEYLLRSKPYVAKFAAASDGVRIGQWDLDIARMREIRVRLPAPGEQTAIVKYLAHANARIDNAIAAKRRLIALLEEQMASSIDEAIMRSMTSSESRVIPLKYLVVGGLRYGANEVAEGTSRELPRYIRITDFGKDGRLRDETFVSIGQEIADKYPVLPGDILLARSGATVGKAFLAPHEIGPACHAGYLIRARCNSQKLLPNYLYAFTRSTRFAKWRSETLIQSTIENISAEKYGALKVPVPPINVQHAVVEGVERAHDETEHAVNKVRREIFLLEEFRTRLVADAVTGQIDVRAIAATLPDAPADSMNRDVDTPAVDGGFDVDVSRGVA